MAVIVKLKSTNGLNALAALGIEQHWLDFLTDSPIGIMVNSKGFVLVDQDELFEKHAVPPEACIVTASLDDLHRLKAGTMPSVRRQQLRTQVQAMLQNVCTMTDLGYPTTGAIKFGYTPAAPSETEEPVSTLSDLPPLAAVQPVVNTVEWPEFDVAKLQTAPTVPLRDASMMYQPVQGTSNGSRYFMVAGGPGIRIACRFKPGSLSVRLEGDKLQSFKDQVGVLGMAFSGSHASIHLQVGDQTLAQKALGAILLGLGIPLTTPLPNLAKVL